MAVEAVANRHRSSETVFTAKRFSDVTAELVSTLRHKHPQKSVAIRPTAPAFEDLAALTKSLKDAAIGQVGFTVQKDQLRRPAARDRSCVNARRPTGLAEVRYYLAESYIERFAKPWADYLGPTRIQDNLNILLTAATTGNTTFAVRDDAPVGMAVCFPHHDCAGIPVLQVAWVWVDGQLASSERQQAHYALCEPLMMSRYRTLQAGIHLKNLRSQRFFTTLGFQPRCVHFDPLKP